LIFSSKIVLAVVIEGAKRGSVVDTLCAVDVLNLFCRIPDADCLLLNIGRPEHFICHQIPVPPVCLRPAIGVASQVGGTHEDDLTAALLNIVRQNGRLRSGIDKGDGLDPLMTSWNMMQLEFASFVDSSVCADGEKKQHRGIVQRLQGKHGRFRLNLSGKRCNFTARSVISPDPNLSVCEVGVPELVAKKLTIREIVHSGNIALLRAAVARGPHSHPGAVTIWRKDRANTLFFGNNKLKVVICFVLFCFASHSTKQNKRLSGLKKEMLWNVICEAGILCCSIDSRGKDFKLFCFVRNLLIFGLFFVVCIATASCVTLRVLCFIAHFD
jgi:DNA-directed RNA polymerase beta' subunit